MYWMWRNDLQKEFKIKFLKVHWRKSSHLSYLFRITVSPRYRCFLNASLISVRLEKTLTSFLLLSSDGHLQYSIYTLSFGSLSVSIHYTPYGEQRQNIEFLYPWSSWETVRVPSSPHWNTKKSISFHHCNYWNFLQKRDVTWRDMTVNRDVTQCFKLFCDKNIPICKAKRKIWLML